ncbi:MAG: aminotransferase class I/II-fold pyridoxal phosphate-dependent enzyme [Chloroflexota bacterium]|nr:MAG: aminotransferase class I/II-fold pyridoxal phosphate-dependent enzyme [Chloroflexota bacterium]
MSPTPVSFSSPVAPAGYTWEATDEEVSARYGVPLDQVARFDLNTSPAPPDLAVRLLAANAFDRPISEYPPSDYRRLSEAAAARYGVARDQVLVGAGADEILDLIAKAFLPSGGAAVIPTPSYAMYRVDTEQRGAEVRAVPRLGPADGFAMDGPAVRAAARGANVVWLCSPNNPTGLAEPAGAIESLLDGLLEDAAGGTEGPIEPPIVVLDEAYAEFAGSSKVGLMATYPRLIVIRTASKAYALAGLRVGFALAGPDVIARLAPYRPPGSVAIPSVHIVTEALLDDGILAENLERVARERDRLSQGLTGLGWIVRPSVTNFVLVDFGTDARAAAVAEALLAHGLVPRTFGAGHPLAHCLRITIRSAAENDRLLAAAATLDLEEIA